MHEPKVLYAADLEGDDLGGLAVATEHAARLSATLLITHVVPFNFHDSESLLIKAVGLVHGRYWKQLMALVPTQREVPYRHILKVGVPEDRLAEVVRREGVGLVVVGARRRSMLARMFTKAFHERLRDSVACPIVTYPEHPHAEHRPSRALETAHEFAQPSVALKEALDARVAGISSWMCSSRDFVSAVAARGSVISAAETLACIGRHANKPHPTESAIALELEKCRVAVGAIGVEIVTGGSLQEHDFGVGRSRSSIAFADQLRREGSAISVPLDSCAQNRDTAPHVILAGAQIRLAGESAYLLFTFDARRDFLRILGQPMHHASAETYAFDAEGTMLSDSRFPDQLRELGLLSRTAGVQTPRQLRVCDPGENLLEARVAEGGDRPLTRMAASATAGQDGCDWDGYRDYRGVEVVGAWRWIPEYGFGVAAEVDRAVA